MPSITRTTLLLILLLAGLAAACTTAQFGPLNQAASPGLQTTAPALSPPEGTSLEEIGAATGEDDPLIVIEEIIVVMLFIATVVGIVARQLRVPYTVGLVVMGVVLTLLPEVNVDIPPNLILSFLVPPLIFEAAFHLNLDDLRRNLAPILALAVPGVVVTMLLVGAVVAWGTGIPLPYALVFGALVAAIDPVAVISLFRRMGVPKRLQVILEGESLLNDGTAIVLFGLVSMLALKQTEFNLIFSIVDFIRIAGGGLLVGYTLGTLISQAISRIDDYLIETTLTSILAFGSYLLAEEIFHVSGVLAVVAAGLVNGNIGPKGMSPTTRIVVFNFWEYFGFLANSFIFLLIGLQIDLQKMLAFWPRIGIAILAVLIARAVTVYGLAWVGRDIPLRWQHVLNWGGLRGAISLALALSLPAALGPAREELQVMAFGVVVFTLLVQGFTMTRLVRGLRLSEQSAMQAEYERRHARAVAVRAAFDHLARMRREGLLSDHTWEILSPILQQHSQALVAAVKEVMLADPSVEAEEMDTARRESLRAQRSALTSLLKDGVITEETYSQLAAEVDAALAGRGIRWPELVRNETTRRLPVDRLLAAVIQEQDFENAASALTKLGITITHLPTVGGFLGRRNITLLIGLTQGQEGAAVEALNKSCKRRVEYLASPLEGTPLPFPAPMPVTVGGATIFTFEVDQYVEF
jgi:CPA1 family monovalent cation:H+ antiporter